MTIDESREAGDRSDTRPAARRDSSGNPNLYSRKQTLPRQARSLAVPKCAVNARWPPIDWPSPINAEGNDPVVLVLWVSVADGKLVACSNGPRYSTVQFDRPKDDLR